MPKPFNKMGLTMETFEEYRTVRAALLYYWDFAIRSPLPDVRARADICTEGVRILDELAEGRYQAPEGRSNAD